MSDWVGLVIAGSVIVSGNWVAGAVRSYHPKVERVADQMASELWDVKNYLKKVEF